MKHPRFISLLRAAALSVTLLVSQGSPALAATHPLDALDAGEIETAGALLSDAGLIDDSTIISVLQLQEPAKAEVLAWKPGQPFSRRAQAVLRRDGKTLQVSLDLSAGQVGEVRELPGVQPIVTEPEMIAVIDAMLADERVRAALEKRGADPAKVFCNPRTVGNFGQPGESERRLLRLDCFDQSQDPSNVSATPIEGLYVTMDVDQKSVVEIIDHEVVPIPPGTFPMTSEPQGPFRVRREIVQAAPHGRNVTLEGSVVRWENWRLHLRFEQRAGLTVSDVAYDDHGSQRSILYQGHISEIFVPYQDPTVGWYFRNYMDEGEYGLGMMSSPLVSGSDCPRDALYLSPVMPDAKGGVTTLPNRICIFERAAGEPTWRHFDAVSEQLDARPEVDLVVRFVSTVGNYDYLFDWIFDAKGGITFRAGATGIDSVKGVRALTANEPTAAADTAFGPLVAPGRAGVWHDHFFSLRLDMDVDSPANRFVLDQLVAGPPAQGPRTSLWHVESKTVSSEPAALHMSMEHPAQWRVSSTSRTSALGYPTSYVLHGDMGAMPLVSPDDPPLARAGFANSHLWVTHHDPNERWAAGDFPNQSTPGQGLPSWSQQRRSLDGEDIVLWYTMGFHHLPSSEDWPVYNIAWHSVRLKPFNFFDQNPALDLPPATAPSE